LADHSIPHLLTQLDGSDSFVQGGHQVIKTAGATRHASRMAQVPVWVNDDREVQKILSKAFPKWRTDQRQKKQAALWNAVIYFYWRAGRTRSQVASDLKITDRKVKDIVGCINRVAAGKRADGSGKRGGKRGRPKMGNLQNI